MRIKILHIFAEKTLNSQNDVPMPTKIVGKQRKDLKKCAKARKKRVTSKRHGADCKSRGAGAETRLSSGSVKRKLRKSAKNA
jgi:hypothetical protein